MMILKTVVKKRTKRGNKKPEKNDFARFVTRIKMISKLSSQSC